MDVAVHPGISKSQDDEVRFLDRVQCHGRLQEMVDDAVKAVLRNLRTYSSRGERKARCTGDSNCGTTRGNRQCRGTQEYDTLFRNDPVNIDVYSDRVEISSPGNLWGGKTLQNLTNGVSRCRNTTLMQLLQKTPLIRGDHDGSAVEGQGSGIQFMINRMKELSLAQPDFHPTFDRFRVILYRGGAEIAANQQWVRSHVGHDLPGRESSVLYTVRALGRASVYDIRDRLGYDSDDIRAILATLVESGLIRQVATDIYEPPETPAITNASDAPAPPAAAPSSRQAIIDTIPTFGTISARDIAEATGKSLQTVHRILRELVDEGVITAIGKSRAVCAPTHANRPSTDCISRTRVDQP